MSSDYSRRGECLSPRSAVVGPPKERHAKMSDQLPDHAKLLEACPSSGGNSIDLVAEHLTRIVRKKKTFEQIRDRFKACECRDASLIELRLIERIWLPNEEHRDLLHDFNEVEASTGWKLVEWHEIMSKLGKCHQFALYALDRDMSGDNRSSFRRWKEFAALAGNELVRCTPCLDNQLSVPGLSGWVKWMQQFAACGELTLPMNTNYVDRELSLSAMKAELDKGAHANELRTAAERNGLERRCTDAVTASILLADWLSNNDWPFENCGEPSHPELQTLEHSMTAIGLNVQIAGTKQKPQKPINSMRSTEAIQPLVGGGRFDDRSIEEIERNTPALNTQSMEWLAARKENLKKLGLETNTLAKYRGAGEGGRSLSEYFGIDKDGRRWRRDSNKTPKSTVYYFLPDLKKRG